MDVTGHNKSHSKQCCMLVHIFLVNGAKLLYGIISYADLHVECRLLGLIHSRTFVTSWLYTSLGTVSHRFFITISV